MADSNVVVPPYLRTLITEREKVWADFERSQKLSAEVSHLSSAVPEVPPADLQLQFGADITPVNELETVLPLLKEKIETTRKLNAEKDRCFSEIESIKQQEKMVIIIGSIAAVLVFIVLVFLIGSLLSGS